MAPRRTLPAGSSVLRFDSTVNTAVIPYHTQPGRLLPRFRTKKKPHDHTLHVSVFDDHEPDGTNGMIWVVRSRPDQMIRRGQAVELHTQSRSSGIGRLSRIYHMSRHWVTFRITGSRGLCSLRVPMLWVDLSDIERHAHSQHYLSLPLYPLPPAAFCTPLILNAHSSPYEFNNENENAIDEPATHT